MNVPDYSDNSLTYAVSPIDRSKYGLGSLNFRAVVHGTTNT